jgi:sporulation protein YlmC with PRC-barrel domain
MTQQRRAGTELIRLGHSGFVAAVPEDDLRGRGVYDPEGQRMGDVEELYIDRQQREVRFVEVGVGGFLGIGERRFLVPVEAVVEVAEDRITIDSGRTEKVSGPAPFDTRVAPPRAGDGGDDYASLPYGDVEDRADRLRRDRLASGYGRWPHGQQ